MEARLSYHGNLLTWNRNGLIRHTVVFEANGTADPDAALVTPESLGRHQSYYIAPATRKVRPASCSYRRTDPASRPSGP